MSDSENDNVASGQSGYRYWTRKIDDAHVLPSNVPQKIEKHHASESVTLPNGASAWNTAGTWETRVVTDRVKNLFSKLIKDYPIDPEGKYIFLSHDNLDFEDDSSIALVRGKRRLGYEITVVLNWSGEGSSGTIKVSELSDHNSDVEGRVTGSGDGIAVVKKHFSSSLKTIMKLIENEIIQAIS